MGLNKKSEVNTHNINLGERHTTEKKKMKSLQVAHRLEGKDVLLIGGGNVAMTRIPKLLPTGCKITLIAPNLHSLLKERYFNSDMETRMGPQCRISVKQDWKPEDQTIYKVIESEFRDDYLFESSTWSMILLCIPDKLESERIYRLCKLRYGQQQMINVADVPEFCDFYFGSNVNLTKDGNLQILISSNGLSPRFTSLVKKQIELMFEDWELDEALEKLGQLRLKIRHLKDMDVDIKYRMQWIKKCTDIFGLSYCHKIDVDKLAELFKSMASQEPKSLEFPLREQMLNIYTS